jgi:hypothetical protein
METPDPALALTAAWEASTLAAHAIGDAVASPDPEERSRRSMAAIEQLDRSRSILARTIPLLKP